MGIIKTIDLLALWGLNKMHRTVLPLGNVFWVLIIIIITLNHCLYYSYHHCCYHTQPLHPPEMPEGETKIGLFRMKEGTWEVSGQISPGLKSVLSLCNLTGKLEFTVITETVNFWGGWHHNISRFLSLLSDTKAQDPCKLAPSRNVV